MKVTLDLIKRTSEAFAAKVELFAMVVERDQLRGLRTRGSDCEENRRNAVTKVTLGGKYIRVDIGTGGRYMVVIGTGEIFGIKGYGVIHRGHYYGTLDTIGEYDWAQYYPTKRDGSLGLQSRNSCPVITKAPECAHRFADLLTRVACVSCGKSRADIQAACDHKFMGTNFCLKCGKLAAELMEAGL